ncbi:hypothetical protein DUNSADRAFT_14946 [Dunaliella salina]|nr:hypothetical protein DUNSADRAFT_14946 [Dunaliella salina]|eukprot:KAF5830170.1 hypothetical protein DUNSADRAFT_14946 [Dunaliella salina]
MHAAPGAPTQQATASTLPSSARQVPDGAAMPSTEGAALPAAPAAPTQQATAFTQPSSAGQVQDGAAMPAIEGAAMHAAHGAPTQQASTSTLPSSARQVLDGPLTEQELEAMLERELEGGDDEEEEEEEAPEESVAPNEQQQLQQQQQQQQQQLMQAQLWQQQQQGQGQEQQQQQEQGPLEPIDIDSALAAIEAEDVKLRGQARTARATEGPSPEMYAECQELLQLFGIPYIVAPVEAEAECAWLDAEGLVEGTVTDDNDVFLFGGCHVYRHSFENKKYVEEYRTSDIEVELGLTQERMGELALLLGSDYTEGVAGIGVVNAMEVVLAFPGLDGLRAFREWVEAPDAELVGMAAQKFGGSQQPQEVAGETEAQRRFKRTHRNVRKNWQLPPSFPSQTVLKAYTHPHVDRSKKAFTFGRPDPELLRVFCQDKFGWSPDRVDELLNPVLKVHDTRQTQLTMHQFLSFNQRFAKIKSKRLQKAVEQSSKVPEHVASVLGIAANDTGGNAELGTTEEGTEEPSEDPASQDAGASPRGRGSGGGRAGTGRRGGRGGSSRGRGRQGSSPRGYDQQAQADLGHTSGDAVEPGSAAPGGGRGRGGRKRKASEASPQQQQQQQQQSQDREANAPEAQAAAGAATQQQQQQQQQQGPCPPPSVPSPAPRAKRRAAADTCARMAAASATHDAEDGAGSQCEEDSDLVRAALVQDSSSGEEWEEGEGSKVRGNSKRRGAKRSGRRAGGAKRGRGQA